MQTTANGLTQDYDLMGPEGAPVVVLAHSLATDRGMWVPQVRALKDRYRILAYDARGHGRTEAPAGAYTLDMMADDLHGLLQALGLDRVRFVGLSMGGMIGQAFALKYPEMLDGLVLSSTTSQIPEQAHPVWDQRIAAVESDGMETQVDATLERWFTQSFRDNNRDTLTWIGEMIRNTPPQGFIGCARAIKPLDLTARLSAIQVPTQVMVGRDDPGTPVSAAETIHQQIPGSQLVVIEEASHQCGIQQPETFNDALLGFLDGLDR